MRVKDIMTRNPITIESETLLMDARKIMRENNIRRLPVVDHGKLVGIITLHDIIEASPSNATSLTMYELNYIISKMKVKEVMKKDPVVLTPDTTFEEALRIGQEKKIGSFPIVDHGRLVGILTESDVVRLLINALGIRHEGSRITIDGLSDDDFKKISSIVHQHDIILLSMISWFREEKNSWLVVLRFKKKDVDGIVKEFRKAGLEVTHVE